MTIIILKPGRYGQVYHSQTFLFSPILQGVKYLLVVILRPGTLLRLMDVSGRVVWQKTITGNTTAIVLPELSPGLYFVQCYGVTKKLIIR